MPLDVKTFTRFLSKMPQGKLAGPYGYIADVIKSMVTHIEYPNKKKIYAQTIFDFYRLIDTNKIPQDIK